MAHLLKGALDQLNEILAAQGTPELRCTFDQFLERVVRPAVLPGEVATMKREQIEAIKKQVATEGRGTVIDRWILEAWEEGRTEGRQEGLEQGRREGLEKGRQEDLEEGQRRGQVLSLRKVLEARFGAIPADVEERLAGASSEQLSRCLDRALQAHSLDAVFKPSQ